MTITAKQQRRIEQQVLLENIKASLERRVAGEIPGVNGDVTETVYNSISQIILRINTFGDFKPVGQARVHKVAHAIFRDEVLNPINRFVNPLEDSSLEFHYLTRRIFEYCSGIVFGPRKNPYEDGTMSYEPLSDTTA